VETILTNSVFIFWASITLICTVPSVAHYWWKVRRDELDASLKQTMLEQGRSAEEIRNILAAGRKERTTGGFTTDSAIHAASEES
jgi:hypothetical protein